MKKQQEMSAYEFAQMNKFVDCFVSAYMGTRVRARGMSEYCMVRIYKDTKRAGGIL